MGIEAKYGGGPEHVQKALTEYSRLIPIIEEEIVWRADEGLPYIKESLEWKERIHQEVTRAIEIWRKVER